jgi:1,4-dihydroxy-2-naphthoate polyprenyltransferase
MNVTVKQSIVTWLNLIRLGAAARGVLPFFLGTVIAWSDGVAINIPTFLLSSVAVLVIMIATFLVNEYFDYETDAMNNGFHRLSGGSRILVLNLVPRKQALYSAYWLFGIAAVIGLILYFGFKTGPLTIPLGTLAIFFGYFYTAKPLKLSYRGIGELSILFTCGWLATILGYYLQTAEITPMVSLISIPGSISIFLLILINEIPDMESDLLSNKRNLAVILGKRSALLLYSTLLIGCWLSMLAIIPFGVPWTTGIFSIILWPIIILNIANAKKNPSDRPTLENLSVRTMFFDHLITFIYSIAFIVVGLSSGRTNRVLVVIILCYLVVFTLEGMSLLFYNRNKNEIDIS